MTSSGQLLTPMDFVVCVVVGFPSRPRGFAHRSPYGLRLPAPGQKVACIPGLDESGRSDQRELTIGAIESHS